MKAIFPANQIEKVGYYGGRIQEGFFGEPLNLVSNIGYIACAAFCFWIWKKRHSTNKALLGLIILCALIGIGSAIFHGHPNKITLQIDLLPIRLFGILFVAFSMRRFLDFSMATSILIAVAFILVSITFGKIRIIGSNHYPAILALLIGGPLLYKKGFIDLGKSFFIATGLFILAFFFRYLEFYLLDKFPLGTHFLWHLCGACFVGVLLHGSIIHDGKRHFA